MKLLSFGEILWDVYPKERFIGGAPLNFAAHFARHGGDTYMLSGVGNDSLGAEALKKLKEWNIHTELVDVLDGLPTGRCLVTLDQRKVPSYELLRDVAYDRISTDKAIGGDFDLLYFGTLALREEYNRLSLKRLIHANEFKEIFVDLNLRPPFVSRENILFALQNATILKVSDEELPEVSKTVFGEALEGFSAAERIGETYKNVKLVIITLGAEGSLAYDCTQKREYKSPAAKAQVVSTVGAGDSFSASFLYHRMQGEDINTCLKRASLLSAYVVSNIGAVPNYNPKEIISKKF